MKMNSYLRKYLPWTLAIAVLMVGAYFVYRNVELAGPEEFQIATGRQGGAYYAFTEEYARQLAIEGVTLQPVETAGSVEVLDRVIGREVPVGLVQSGTIGDKDKTELYSIGTVFYEPILIFYRKDRFDEPLEYLYDLEYKTVGVGEPGSGTNLLTRQMLAENELDDTNVALQELPSIDAYEALTAGEIDAAFFVLSPEAEIVFDLLTDPTLELMNMRRAGAYEARYPYLTEFTISEGTADLRLNIPDEDKVVLATTAMLVANELLHVDSARQLLTAAYEVHGGGDFFAAEGEFPSANNGELPVPNQVEQYLELGPSDLEEFLPVSIATIVQRLVFIVLPAIILLYPLLRSTPGAYAFANRYRVYRWYQQLRHIEAGMDDYSPPELEAQIIELQKLEHRLSEGMRIPLFYQRDFYNLRHHLRLVIERFERRRDELLAESKDQVTAEDGADVEPANDAIDLSQISGETSTAHEDDAVSQAETEAAISDPEIA